MEFEDFKPLTDPKNLSGDMVHPNVKGYWHAANYILEHPETNIRYYIPDIFVWNIELWRKNLF